MDKPSKRVRPILKVEPQIPDPSANDDSRTALQAAARSYKLVKDQWCDCENGQRRSDARKFQQWLTDTWLRRINRIRTDKR
jgi:hypothetical protein